MWEALSSFGGVVATIAIIMAATWVWDKIVGEEDK